MTRFVFSILKSLFLKTFLCFTLGVKYLTGYLLDKGLFSNSKIDSTCNYKYLIVGYLIDNMNKNMYKYR